MCRDGGRSKVVEGESDSLSKSNYNRDLRGHNAARTAVWRAVATNDAVIDREACHCATLLIHTTPLFYINFIVPL